MQILEKPGGFARMIALAAMSVYFAAFLLVPQAHAAQCKGADGAWYDYTSPMCQSGSKQATPTPTPRSSASTSNKEKENKALALLMYAMGKCGGLSGREEDACVDGIREELNDEGKAYFDAYFSK
ncbi:hypothetical protein [Sedimenticola hydrogenitrophicus]|uniref:hypothetical protein n=1 Tax=Sedimenticola hydrogenitrophicus TaxID=2967975 RepID=UPI0023B0DA7D|nr:hypothetical protein [Sedimenticola hydrogenitrophicus]